MLSLSELFSHWNQPFFLLYLDLSLSLSLSLISSDVILLGFIAESETVPEEPVC